ncbi:MAG: hypothetical protein LBS27_07560 [Bifidobacteriaceae bacterium]|jgi:hypothetical protein|nr:hypothetical protein [Bifidobacteriaceae bacterium]
MLSYFERYTARAWTSFTALDVEAALVSKCRATLASFDILPEGQLAHEVDTSVERYRTPLTITDVGWLESVTPASDFAVNNLAAVGHPESPNGNGSVAESLREMVNEEHEYGLRLTVLLKESLGAAPVVTGHTVLGWIGSRHVTSLIDAMSGWPDSTPENPEYDEFREYLGILVAHGLI